MWSELLRELLSKLLDDLKEARRYDLKVCDDVKLAQILRSWTLSIVSSLSKGHPVSLSNHVLETGFCLRLQVKPAQLGPIDRASLA
jgi:hypothetical protein